MRLNVEVGNYDVALADLEVVLDSEYGRTHGPALLMLKGEILSHGLGRIEEAEEVFRTVIDRYGHMPSGQRALLHLANVKMLQRHYNEGMEILKGLDRRNDVAESVSSRATFLRARFLEELGEWGEAVKLLRQICRAYPQTLAAAEAPVVIARHYVAAGDYARAEKNLEVASKYYVEVIGQESAFLRHKLLVLDFLIENYLLLERPREAAMLLEAESPRWGEAARAGALLKAGMLYLNLLQEPDEAERLLEKCVELFPKTSYARLAQSHIDRIGIN